MSVTWKISRKCFEELENYTRSIAALSENRPDLEELEEELSFLLVNLERGNHIKEDASDDQKK